jgi:hypothetical protein
MEKFNEFMDDVQSTLNFHGCRNVHYNSPHGIGKIGFTGFVVGLLAGIHLCLAIMLLIATSCSTLLQQSLVCILLLVLSLMINGFLCYNIVGLVIVLHFSHILSFLGIFHNLSLST